MLGRLRIEQKNPEGFGPPYRVLLDDLDISNYITQVQVRFFASRYPDELPEATFIVRPSSVEIDGKVLARLEAHVRDTGVA